MKNSIFALGMKLLLFVLISFCSVLQVSAATITSTINGGYWGSTNTWEGGVLPGVGDDIVIQGSVFITQYITVYGDIEISEGGQLYSSSSSSKGMTVIGDIFNYGRIGLSTNDSNRIIVYSHGDITNGTGAIWDISDVYISGLYGDPMDPTNIPDTSRKLNVNQGDFVTNLYITGDVKLEGKFHFPGRLWLQGNTATFDGEFENYLYTIRGPGKIVVERQDGEETSLKVRLTQGASAESLLVDFDVDNLEIGIPDRIKAKNVKVTERITGNITADNIEIDGNISFNQSITINGNVTINEDSSLYKSNGYSIFSLRIVGNLLNKGELGRNITYGKRFSFYLDGDIKNLGKIHTLEKIYIYIMKYYK